MPWDQSFPYLEWDGRVQLENSSGILINPATEAKQDALIAVFDSVMQHWHTPINEDSEAIVVTSKPANVDRIWFTKAISNGIDTSWGSIVGSIGNGMTVNQTGWNLVITSGTTARSETIIRSTLEYLGWIRLRARSTLSQRIANNNFIVEMVDVIWDWLAYTINSATSITVTLPVWFGLSSQNVGQQMTLGMFSWTGTFLWGRYPIASVSWNNATFTVSGFAVGTGTVSVFWWNFYRLVYDGTIATNAKFDTGRNGYASGDTTATINTTASPWHLAVITVNDLVSTFADQLVASSTTIKQTIRASRDENVPDDVSIRLQIRVLNGSTAPASTTTWTIGLVSVTNYSPQSVNIQDVRPLGTGSALPVEIMRWVALATQPVSGTIGVSSATLSIPFLVADIASAAISTNTTTGAITPTNWVWYTVNIPVTAVSGTNPTMDVAIEESDDNGTNWRRVYEFPRITATWFYSSQAIMFQWTRVRYVQTIGWTTPSFTRSVNRMQRQNNSNILYRQRFDRTLVINTLNSIGQVLETLGSRNVQMVLNLSAGWTAPSIQLQWSDDNLNWYNIGTPLAWTVSGTVQSTTGYVSPKFIRPIVSTAWVGATLGYLLIKSW